MNVISPAVFLGPDAELIRTCRHHKATIAALNASPGLLADETSPELRAYSASAFEISAAEPQTLAGIVAKAQAALAESQNDDDSPDLCSGTLQECWGWDLIHDLVRLFGDREGTA